MKRLEVQNLGDVPVVLFSGEILVGGRQDRTLQRDVVVAPRSGWIEVPSLCTQHGRWSGRRELHTSSSFVPVETRAVASQADQGTVWRSISETQVSLQVPSNSQAARETYENKSVVFPKLLPSFIASALAAAPVNEAPPESEVQGLLADPSEARNIFQSILPALIDNCKSNLLIRRLLLQLSISYWTTTVKDLMSKF